jgi:undecaprenyl diphosphate synthase
MTESEIVPNHVGLILDGNRRWAEDNGLSKLEGHKRGYGNLKTIGRAILATEGINYVSAYTFSTENWNRSPEEVAYLMELLLWVAQEDVKELHESGIRVRFLGSHDRLSTEIVQAMEAAEHLTANNDRGNLGICLNYGGKQEIVDAFKAIEASGLAIEEVTTEIVDQYLYAPEFPNLDLVIRTGGAMRTSNFHIWRAAYAEFWVTDKFWPAFTVEDWEQALVDFGNRERRFGGDRSS